MSSSRAAVRRPALRRPAARVLLAAALGVVLAACTTGDDQADEDPPSTTTISPAPDTAEPTEDQPTPDEPDEPEDTATTAPGPDEVVDGFYDDRDGFSIQFPPDWTVQRDGFGLQVFGTPPEQLAPDFADNIGVLFEDTGQPGITAGEYVELSIAQAPTIIDGFELLDQVVVDDTLAAIEYLGNVDRPLHFLAVVRVLDGRAYTATFTATTDTYEANLPAAQEILDTLRAT